MIVDNLFKFCMISNVTFVVNSSGIITRAAHLPSSSSYQYNLNFWRRYLLLDISLYQRDAPVLFNTLTYQIFAHGIVPHVSCINTAESSAKDLCLIAALSLHASCQINMKAKICSISDVFCYLFYYWFNLFDFLFSHFRV